MTRDKDMIKEVITKPELNFFVSILIPLLALAVSWGAMTSRLDHVQALATGLQNQYGEQSKINEQIQVKLAEIQKDILYIRAAVEKQERK